VGPARGERYNWKRQFELIILTPSGKRAGRGRGGTAHQEKQICHLVERRQEGNEVKLHMTMRGD
jgi:hypothetical protein